jgi:hypothetical protein
MVIVLEMHHIAILCADEFLAREKGKGDGGWIK